MKNLYRRVLESMGVCAVLFGFIVFAYHPILQYLVVLCVAGLSGIALWEYKKLAAVKGASVVTSRLIFWGMAVVVSFFFAARFGWPQSTPLVVLMVAILSLFAGHFRDYRGALPDMAFAAFGLLYIAVPVGMILGILYFEPADGRFWMLYLFLVTKIGDVAAYFGGSLLGKHPLARSISPGKTIEGGLIGWFTAIGTSLLFYVFSWISWPEAMILGILLGSVGQFGDLSESLLKRDAEKKDSSQWPGLGGALDALDSLLFNAPIIYLYLVAGYS